MKPGAVKMRYPDGDPENGPAYMQQWTGEEWVCAFHKCHYDEETKEVHCARCGKRIMTKHEVQAIMMKVGKK